MWILPTYNRPGLLEQTLKLFSGVSTNGLILVNGCRSPEYEKAVSFAPPGWEVEYLPKNLGWAQACNYAFENYPGEPWYGFFYDDMNPVSYGWDAKLVEALKPGHIVSAVNNWHNPPRIQTAVIDGDLAREVGFLTLPGSWACYTDDFWERLGTELNCWTVLDDVVVETLNPRKGDYEWDEATELAYNEDALTADKKIWKQFRKGAYQNTRERVRERFSVGAKREVVLSDYSVAICTPSADGKPAATYSMSLYESLTALYPLGVGTALFILDKCSILPYARNRLVADFLQTSATHMLFVDDDMGWPAHAIPELLAHDKDVIAAVGITKDEDPEKRHFCVGLDPKVTQFDPTRGIMRVNQVGTGFMLIKRHVLEKMWKKYSTKQTSTPVDAPHLGPISWVFDYDVGNSDGWGEDFTFCRRWREMGGEVWIDPSIRLIHMGHYCYTGTYLDWIQQQHNEYAKGEAA